MSALILTPKFKGENIGTRIRQDVEINCTDFVNALMRIAGYKPGIVRIEYPEVFTQELNRKILDFPVLSR